MAIFNVPLGINLTDNDPINVSPFGFGPANETSFIPPTSFFIITEDVKFILTEDNKFMITE